VLRRGLAFALALAGALLLLQGGLPRADRVDTLAPSPSFTTSRPATTVVTATPSDLAPIPAGYRVKIPRLGIDLPIAEGIVQRDVEQQQTPEGFAFHLPGTSIPGQRGNTYIYSHARVGMFLALWDARVGDDVVITTPDGRTLRYAVAEVRPRVSPTDISVAQPTDDERLTLQTSTGPVPEDPRFVVIALPR
jgi:LPXTG-site transpeptidase (sortase) family protein